MPDGRIKWISAAGQPKELSNGSIEWQSLALDITDKKNAEIKLAESEEMLTDITNNLPGLIYRYIIYPDGTDKIQFISDGCIDLWEVSKEDILADAKNGWAKIHPDDLKEFSKSVEKSAAELSIWNAEWRLVMDDGRGKWVSGIGQPKKLVDGSLLWHTLQLDITDKKSFEIALAQSEEMLSDIANNLPGLILRYIIYPDGTDQIQFLSDGCIDVWEVSKEEALADVSKVWAKIHPDDLITFSKSIDKSAADLSTWKAEWRFVMDDGRVKWISGIGQPRKLADGSTLWHTIQLDITDKKNVEIALENTLQQLNLSIVAGKIGVWELNFKDGHLDWNDQMFEIFGIEKSSYDFSVDTFTKSIHPEDRAFTSNELGKIAQGGVLEDIQFRIVRPDGQIRHINASGKPSSYNENGEVEKFMGVNMDVTHIAENQERLKVAIQEKDALFKELHHRIKNNLQMVSSLLYIKSTMTDDMTLKHFIDETSAKIRSIASIHEHLLQMQGVNELDVKDYLEALCQNLVQTYSYSDSKFELKMDLDAVIMDIDRVLGIGLIVNEIISNTMKYAYPDSGAGKIHIALEHENKNSILTVSDNGIGIPTEKISKIDNSYGMQLIYLFTQQIEGTININNNNGTKYTIKFPTNV
jgi:two-component sensor histidine kinase